MKENSKQTFLYITTEVGKLDVHKQNALTYVITLL